MTANSTAVSANGVLAEGVGSGNWSNVTFDGTHFTVDTTQGATGGLKSTGNVYNTSEVLTGTVDNFTSGDTIAAAVGTDSGLSFNGTNVTGNLTASDGTPVGTLAVNASTDHGTLTLSDGFQITLNSIPAQASIAAAPSNDTPEQALLAYLGNLGDSLTAAQLDQQNFTYQNPTGSTYTLNGTPDQHGNLDFTVTSTTAPGAQITGATGKTANMITASGDMSQDTISNVQILDVAGNAELTSAELNAFTTVEGSGTIFLTTQGTVNLTNAAFSSATALNLVANDWSSTGITFTGNNLNNQTLTASAFGTDTLTAGNGTGDILNAGEGVDTITGGTNGSNTFNATSGLASGSAVTGHGSSNVLNADGDISGATISDIQTLNIGNSGTITLKASELSGFTTLNGNGTINAASAGTYSVSGNANAFNMNSDATDSITLTGNNVNSEILNADNSSGTDSLTVGTGTNDQVLADGTTGSDTLAAGTGANDVLSAQGSTGGASGDTLTAGGGNFDILNVDNSSGANHLTTTGTGQSQILHADGSTGSNIMTSGDGPSDALTAIDSFGNNQITAGAGAGDSITITGATGNNTLKTGNGNNDSINANSTSGTNTLTAGSGTGDILSVAGSTGNNTLNAGSGGDFLFAGSGTDTLNGGVGNDQFTITAVTPGAHVTGGGGSDTLIAGTTDISGMTISGVATLADASSALKLNSSQWSEFTTLANALGASATLDLYQAGTYDLTTKTITGTGTFNLDATQTTGTVTLTAGSQAGVVLKAGSGTDTLNAGSGGDALFDSTGTATLNGGSGIDTFNVSNPLGGTVVNGGTGDIANVSGNGTNHSTDAVTISSGTVTVANNAEADIYGSSDTVTAGTNDAVGIQGGNNDTLTIGSGGGVWVNNGTGHTVNAANGDTVNVAGNGQSGPTDTVNMSSGSVNEANSADVTIVGTGNTVTSGTSDTVNIAANGENNPTNAVVISSGTVNVTTNADCDVYGNSNTITAGQTDAVGISGNSNNLTIGANGGVWLNSGTGNTVNAGNSDTINVASGIGGTLNGGGSDSYQFASTFGLDVINNAATGGAMSANGQVGFASGVTDEKLWYFKSGSDLLIDLLGTTDQIKVAGWYGTNAGEQVQKFTAGGLTLDTQVAALVTAMATYQTAHPSFNPQTASSMPTDTTLQNAIAAAWHT